MSFSGNGMEAFQYTALPARVLFGFGTIAKVADELVYLDCKRAFVLSDPHHATAAAARLMRVLGDLGVHLSTDAVMHTPVEVTERVMEKLAACDADCIVALGGGSTIGLAKALALRTDLPQIVLPTTYAGSEATSVLGETRKGQKSTIRSMKVLPEVIVYDVELTYGLPPAISLVSGINAIAHAVEVALRKGCQPRYVKSRGAGHRSPRTCAAPDCIRTDEPERSRRCPFWSLGSIIAVNDSSRGDIFPELTRDVIDRVKNAESSRLREILTLVVSHVHTIVREAKITHDEWWQAIDFLTRAGKVCSDSRQEFILLSDILGISMLVDAIDYAGGPGLSESAVLGPFYAGQQRELAAGKSILLREEASDPLEMRGRVMDSQGRPIANALVEVWQTAPNQLYDVQDEDQPDGHLRGSFRTDGAGTFRFRTIIPVSYPIPNDGPAGQLLAAMGSHPFRPAHIHFMISAPGYRTLVTHLFLDGDQYLGSDAVFGSSRLS